MKHLLPLHFIGSSLASKKCRQVVDPGPSGHDEHPNPTFQCGARMAHPKTECRRHGSHKILPQSIIQAP